MKNHSRNQNRENSNLVSRLLKYVGIGSVVLGSLGLVGYLNAPKQAKPNQPKVEQTVKEYGVTIFERNSELPNQLYIVAQRHRNPITGKNDKNVNTPKIQTEVYRIATDLVNNKGVELVLEEGRFSDADYFDEIKKQRYFLQSGNTEQDKLRWKSLSDERLENILEKEDALINAPFLLNVNYGVNVQGAENKELHKDQLRLANLVGENYTKLAEDLRNGKVNDKNIQEAKELLSKQKEINDLFSENRSAYLLLNAPEVVERELNKGRIKNRKVAILIGVNHIDEIVKSLNEGYLKVHSKNIEINGQKFEVKGMDRKLDFKEKNYGVSVIVPRSLY